jgi:hypothetical protein
VHSSSRRSGSILIAFILLVVVGWGDYATGYEVSFGPLYALTIAWTTWRLNLAWGLAFSVLSPGIWLYADLASGDHYRRWWHAWERAAMMLIMMVFVAVSFHVFKRVLRAEQKRAKEMEGALPICACCKRIQDSNGYWMEMGAYLREHSKLDPQSKLCPECARAKYVSGYSATS